MTQVEFTTGARLHFGLMCGTPASDWYHGGIGLMVRQPGWYGQVSTISDHDSDFVEASTAVSTRIDSIITAARAKIPHLPPVRCHIHQESRFHSGLGAGTQLTLGLTSALMVLAGIGRPADVATLSADLGRSRRSAIGTFGFDHGGFVVDHGYGADSNRPRCRHVRFPDEWRMVLILPRTTVGLSGQAEETFFDGARKMDDGTVSQLISVVSDNVEPALRNGDFPAFRDSLVEYGRRVGDYFSSEQGGVYSSPLVRDLVAHREISDLQPVQSSWGPGVCIPAESDDHASEVVRRLSRFVSDADAAISVTTGLNCGAIVKTMAPVDYRSFG